MIIKLYFICTVMTMTDEIWNIQHPRPFPKQHYYMLQWEQNDFIQLKNGDWILRLERKTDSELKKAIRERYHVLQYKQRNKYYIKKQ